MEDQNKSPVHEVRLGQIKASIWLKRGVNGMWHSITLARLYKEGDDWKQTSGFQRDDLLIVAKVADIAHTWIHQHPA